MKKITQMPAYHLSSATAISPIDGRYNEKTNELSQFFSEMALVRFRLLVEVEWLIFLSVVVKTIRRMTKQEKTFLRKLYRNFSEQNFYGIKRLEKTTNHDVKAVELWLRQSLQKTSLADLIEFVHIGLTSEDINNTAFGFMLRGGVKSLFLQYFRVLAELQNIISVNAHVPLLAHTHGQPASPTTIGWEMKIYFERLYSLFDELVGSELLIKFGGATGGHNALYVAWPKINWRKYSEQFVNKLNRTENHDHRFSLTFSFNPYCTQIENHDTYAKLFGVIERANTVLIDFNRDMWTYISMKVFIEETKEGEVGSSTMPHKVNPIDFENSEGNLGIANALFRHFSEKLPISRLQRDLTDSTVIRVFGTAFGHNLVALKSLVKGLKKVYVNTSQIKLMLDENWAILAEPIQTILRREGVNQAYDLLKDLTRGKAEIDQRALNVFIYEIAKENNLTKEVVEELKSLSPHTYLGNRDID